MLKRFGLTKKAVELENGRHLLRVPSAFVNALQVLSSRHSLVYLGNMKTNNNAQSGFLNVQTVAVSLGMLLWIQIDAEKVYSANYQLLYILCHICINNVHQDLLHSLNVSQVICRLCWLSAHSGSKNASLGRRQTVRTGQ